MLCEDALPVADAMLAPTSTSMTRLMPEAVDNFVDNYDLMGGEGGNFEKYSLSGQMVHFCGGHFSRVHWSACKAVLAFYE